MRHIGNIWAAVKLIGSARDLAVERRQLQWDVQPPGTFFLEAEQSDVSLIRQDQAQVRAVLELHAGFGWQLASDQDEAGVYLVAKRKAVIGSIARARIEVTLPRDIHISLDLRHCRLCLKDAHTALELPPPILEGQ